MEGGDSGWDIVNAESEELEIACQEGLILPLDIDKLGGKDNYVPGAVHKCGIGAATAAATSQVTECPQLRSGSGAQGLRSGQTFMFGRRAVSLISKRL
ncbi:hypothetical protein [Mesorhizobium sp. M0047]|uniref:hypothetical protein n=1 Tax=Mesorhizobium sp. M0047 TaxID=2956859 RepID=UPI003335DE8D